VRRTALTPAACGRHPLSPFEERGKNDPQRLLRNEAAITGIFAIKVRLFQSAQADFVAAALSHDFNPGHHVGNVSNTSAHTATQRRTP